MKKLSLICLFLVFMLFPGALSAKDDTYRELSDFAKALSIIEENYVEDILSEQLVRSAIKGMFNSLDPYSAYLSSDRLRDLEIGTMGEFEGIGVEITVKDGMLTVISPIEGSPAERAGIKSGDVIVSIDGSETAKTSIADAMERVRGRSGTKVDILVRRKGEAEELGFSITRQVVKISSVVSKLVEKDMGYVKLSQFHANSAEEFLNSYRELEKENGAELTGLILDLRNNPGGLLEQALLLCDMFIDSGTILNVRGKSPNTSKEHFAREETEVSSHPVVVMVNGGSASAAEILAGALKENGRAKIVGTRTFGKGSLQRVMELSPDTGIKITTAKLYTPKGKLIDGNGIEPDIEVEDGSEDAQLAKAVETIKSM